ncbi:MAG: ABC transporter permease [Oscillospiraceae bacterium]|nr:ABC transporter permease [Oscillospiraceae bacterium]
MAKYILKKVGIALLTVLVLATLTFFLVKILPGDPFLNDKVPAAVQERQRAFYGLDKPLAEQYLTYMKNLLRGDLGTSLKQIGREVTTIIRDAFPVSARLGLAAFVFSQVVGIVFGILCAQFRGRLPDYILMIVAVLGVALPSMVLGPLLRYLFGVKLMVLPVSGWGTFRQAVLPVLVLSISGIAASTRSMRASMLAVTTQDYIKTARAKGLAPWKVVLRHQLKNSLVPILTNMGVTLASIMMGSFVVESIFLIPGLGKYFVDCVTTLDYPLVMGLTIFYGAFLVTANLIIDVLYGLADPRIRVK